LQKPLRRTRPKTDSDPGWREIEWDEALDEIAAQFDKIRRESGPEAVGFVVSSPSGTPMSDSFEWIDRFIRIFGSPNHSNATEICNWQKDFAHAFTFGCGMPPGDYRNSDLVVLWGFNPANSWLAIAGEVEEARKRSAQLMVVDPRRAGQAATADYWLGLRPGTDGALALGLAHLILKQRAFDDDFVRKWTNGPLLVRVDTGRFLRAHDLRDNLPAGEFVAWDESTGGPLRYDPKAEVPDNAAAAFALRGVFSVMIGGVLVPCRPAFDYYAEVVEAYTPARVADICGIAEEDLQRAAAALIAANSISYHAWTGVAQHTNATQAERAIAVLYALTGHFDKRGGNVQLRRQPINPINPASLLAPTQAAKAVGLARLPIGPPTHGWVPINDVYTAILDRKPYAIRGLMGFGANILVSLAETDRGRAALAALDFHVHCDLFETPTARYADIVLPVNSPWEREGLRTGFEISAEADALVQLRQPMVASQGESRSDLSIVFALAKRLGLGNSFFDGDVEAAWNHTLAPLGVTVDMLRQYPEGIRKPVPQSYRKYASTLDGIVTGFATPTRRVEIYSEWMLQHGYSPVPVYGATIGKDEAADYPCLLTTARNGYYCHSQQRSHVTLRKRAPEPTLELSQALAADKGICQGDWVVVTTPTGQARFKARLDGNLQYETIVAEYGWWEACKDMALPGYDPFDRLGSNYNRLIGAASDPVSGAVAMRSTACRIEREVQPGLRDMRRTPMRVARRETECEGVLSVTLEPVAPGPLPGFQAGQHVIVQAECPARETTARAYSLSRSTIGSDSYTISVKQIADDGGEGVMSSHIHRSLAVGDVLHVGPPQGAFRIPIDADFPVVLIAAGIGVTPFISYLDALDPATMPSVNLLYGNRNRRSHAFASHITTLQAKLPRLTVCNFYSRPDDLDRKHAGFDREGRIVAADVVSSLIAQRARFYLCGPDGMLREMTGGLVRRGVPKFEIFVERFFVAAEQAPIDPSARHEVRFARSGLISVWNSRDGDLLKFGETLGLAMPSGCRTGQCESCAVRVLSGQVRHLISVETDDAELCLTCRAVPASDLVLDI
jgi:anaerobic selenocysteine-containing dehydrogenase/ferredoxin-NADP reductase